MWDIASTTDALTTAFSNTGVILALVVGTVLVAIVALIGLGYGIRKLTKKITGGKW